MSMVKVICTWKPIGDIRTRQPKSPGQRKFDWNIVKTVPDEKKIVWANSCGKKGSEDYRCTFCGQPSHPRV